MGTGSGVACQEAAVRVFRLFGIRTETFLLCEPEPLVGYPDPLITLLLAAGVGDYPEQVMVTEVSYGSHQQNVM